MTAPPVFRGTEDEAAEFVAAIEHNCTCSWVEDSTFQNGKRRSNSILCGACLLYKIDPIPLVYARRRRRVLEREEFLMPALSPEAEGEMIRKELACPT